MLAVYDSSAIVAVNTEYMTQNAFKQEQRAFMDMRNLQNTPKKLDINDVIQVRV